VASRGISKTSAFPLRYAGIPEPADKLRHGLGIWYYHGHRTPVHVAASENVRPRAPRGELPVRMQVALYHRQHTPASQIDHFSQVRHTFNNDDKLRISAVKLYSDDVRLNRTPRPCWPLHGSPRRTGKLLWAPSEFNDVAARIDRLGFQIFIHATGDRRNTNGVGCDWHAQRVNGRVTAAIKSFMTSACRLRDIPRYHGFRDRCLHAAPITVRRDITGQWAAAVGLNVPSTLAISESPRFRRGFWPLVATGTCGDGPTHWQSTQHSPEKAGTGSQKVAGFEIRRSTWRLRFAAYTINGAYANFG